MRPRRLEVTATVENAYLYMDMCGHVLVYIYIYTCIYYT